MSLRAIFFLVGRYFCPRRREKNFIAPFLSILGLATGVLTLNAVLAVINGFQLTFIDNILEILSSHVRWQTSVPPTPELRQKILAVPGVRSVQPYYESHILIQGPWLNQSGAVFRGVDPEIWHEDQKMRDLLVLTQGRFISQDNEVILGTELARFVGATVGNTVFLTALTGPSFSLLEPQSKPFLVVGIFQTGYFELDFGWTLGTLQALKEDFAGPGDFHYGIKLKDERADALTIPLLAKTMKAPLEEWVSWRVFNPSFFGALRMEKAAMMFLIGLIFLVVGINIFYSQQRRIREHRQAIAIFQSVGLSAKKVRVIFVLEGALVGFLGAFLGTVLGLMTSKSIPWLLGLVQKTVNSFLELFQQQDVVIFSSEAFYLPLIPVQILPIEVILIASVAFLTACIAAWVASRRITRTPITEVLRNE